MTVGVKSRDKVRAEKKVLRQSAFPGAMAEPCVDLARLRCPVMRSVLLSVLLPRDVAQDQLMRVKEIAFPHG